jgi:hypothetical protein
VAVGVAAGVAVDFGVAVGVALDPAVAVGVAVGFGVAVGVAVAFGVAVGVAVGVGVGGGPEIPTLAENSEVLPAGSVAVEAILWYPGLLFTEAVKEALPLLSVMRLSEPR